MDILIGIIGIICSWFFTHSYFKKSMRLQSEESQEEIKNLLSVLENLQNNNRAVFMAKILEEAIDEYRRAGTPVKVLDSYNDLTDEEKADLYDKVMLRVKGRLGKSNKYRNISNC